MRRSDQLSSRLKCLACSIKWWSKAKYVQQLPDHVERSRKGMTDIDILERIMDGTLWVEGETAWVIDRCKAKVPLTVRTRTSSRSTYQFIEVSSRGRKKAIALHRLVWMYHHKQVVPEGYDVDHRFGKNIEKPNSIENLRLLESSVNRSIGKPNDEF